MTYKILVVRPPEDFSENIESAVAELTVMVNDHLDQGWKTQGGVAIAHNSCSTEQSVFMLQAMIRKDDA